MAHESEAPVGSLVRGALDDLRDLFREELALARAEMRQELSKLAAAGVQFGMAGVALWFAGMFLLVTVALGVAAVFNLPTWAGFGIVAVILGAIGVVLFVGARSSLRRVEPMPRTVGSIKENFQ